MKVQPNLLHDLADGERSNGRAEKSKYSREPSYGAAVDGRDRNLSNQRLILTIQNILHDLVLQQVAYQSGHESRYAGGKARIAQTKHHHGQARLLTVQKGHHNQTERRTECG